MGSISDAVARLRDDVTMVGLPALRERRFGLSIDGQAFTVTVSEAGVEAGAETGSGAELDFSYTLDTQAWQLFCQEPPPRGYTTAQAVRATLEGRCVEGDMVAWAACAPLLDRILEAVRTRVVGPRPATHPDPAPPGDSPIIGRYLNVEVAGESRRIYYEAAGEGQPVLCLHTAGADSRQFRYLLEDEELTGRYRFIAFDMPWHGRSDPPDDWATTSYELDTQTYADTILAVMDRLGLQRPILMGCSMGGSIALYLASRHGERFSGVCALEGGLGNPGRFVPWTNHMEADHSRFLTSWVGGLIAPSSPPGPRAQTLWGYAQGGPGVYQGDTAFYGKDFPLHTQDLEPATCPLWVFSGEYDYSATTEMSREAASRLGGELVEMKGAGHFPMSEDPAAFRQQIVPVLDKIAQAAR
jgi:pimeloyl-ACP methyl ester carboxylesterase